jgi:hypothetical protein
MGQFVPLTFNRYIIRNSIYTTADKQQVWPKDKDKNFYVIIGDKNHTGRIKFYTIQNDVIYGYFVDGDCLFSYDYISNTSIITYDCQEYFQLVKEKCFPHPIQFQSSDYWLAIYQNPLCWFLVKDRYRDELINSSWFKEYCEYETENK